MQSLPLHLQKYIVQQNYERYTPLDQAIWRYILRQLKKFLSVHAHESYLSGLEKTGIDIEKIPRIEEMSSKLEKFGWRALPVSGFIPPAAFMELQSLGVLPIASDIRTIEHLLYTPAPDIVHEAAGHAPILAHEEYANYLKEYAQVAKKAILSKEDLDQYEAIRELSDIKENPASTKIEIEAAENKLKEVTKKISYISEGSQLSRMNWWTAEYGLIKDKHQNKIFGAGLLSSVGESKWCLSDKVKKIPLSIGCVEQSYDITEPQPQLFVADSFQHLSEVLKEFSQTMAYKQGGIQAVNKLIQAKTVNTIEFENHLQISGVLQSFKTSKSSPEEICYVQFSGPSQLSFKDEQIPKHGPQCHKEGYGTPVGKIKNINFDQLTIHQHYDFEYFSGVKLSGTLVNILKINSSSIILSFEKATCSFNEEILFKPEWGTYDIVIAEKIISGFGGPADRQAYGLVEDFVASRVPQPHYTEKQKQIFSLYQQVRDFREKNSSSDTEFKQLFLQASLIASDQWLLFIELIEIGLKQNFSLDFLKIIYFHLEKIKHSQPVTISLIEEGLKLAEEIKG